MPIKHCSEVIWDKLKDLEELLQMLVRSLY